MRARRFGIEIKTAPQSGAAPRSGLCTRPPPLSRYRYRSEDSGVKANKRKFNIVTNFSSPSKGKFASI